MTAHCFDLDQPAATQCRAQCSPQSRLSTISAAPVGIFHRGGTLPTAVCLAKAAIGAGVLSMGVHCAEVGVIFTTVGLVFGAVLTIISTTLIAKASVHTGHWSFEDISDELLHPALAFWTGFLNASSCLGAAASYLIVCGQVFVILSGCGENGRKAFVTGVAVLICGPLSLAREVGFLRHLAALSIGAIFLLVICVVVWPIQHGIDDSIDIDSFENGRGGATAFVYMNSVNNMIFAYCNAFNVPQLTGELTPQPGVRRMTLVGVVAVSVTFLLYSSVSVAGVLAFGVETIKDDFVLDLAPGRNDPLVLVTLAGVMFSVIVCFQFQIYPIRQFCAYGFRKVRGLSSEGNAADSKQVAGVQFARLVDMCCGVVTVLVALLIALVVTEIRVVLDFIGAFASSWISYVVPPLWVIQMRRTGKGFTWFDGEVIGCSILFIVGLFLFSFGTYAAIRG